jgi:hypothetical protein
MTSDDALSDDGLPKDPRFAAAMELVIRAGARSIRLRRTVDDEPTVYLVVAEFRLDSRGEAVAESDRVVYEVGAGFDPLQAAFRFCDQLIDGAICVHCSQPAGFEAGMKPPSLDLGICWYVFDPETKTYRRSCEDGTAKSSHPGGAT